MEMEQTMEHIIERLMAERKALLKDDQEKMMAKMEVNHEEIMAIMGADQGETKVYPKKREIFPEEIQVVAERRKVPNEEAAMEPLGALKDRYGKGPLAVGCRRQSKKLTQGDGGSRQKLIAARGRCTALSKGGSCRGPEKDEMTGSENEAGDKSYSLKPMGHPMRPSDKSSDLRSRGEQPSFHGAAEDECLDIVEDSAPHPNERRD
jgi:hypothetical protein